MDKYKIKGMSCAACSARVEKAVSAVDGVKSVSVNLLTGSMQVEGAEPSAVIDAVVRAGYSAELAGEKNNTESGENSSKSDTRPLFVRFCLSISLLALLVYVSMGHVMNGLPLPRFLSNPTAVLILELALSGAIMLFNFKFFKNGFSSLLKGAPNMDTLVALGSFVSFVYSLAAVLAAAVSGALTYHVLMGTYFESAAMILSFVVLGKFLEAKAKGKTTSAIQSLLALTPKTARVVRDGKEIVIQTSEVLVGDTFIVFPGESFPVDGEVLSGFGAVNEASLTGESLPVDKTVASQVFSGTQNLTGHLTCRAVKVGEDTLMSEVVKLVSEAASGKAPVSKLADRVAGVFVPLVIALAFLTSLVWFFVNNNLGYALARGVSVLVISCPCALGLATPVAIMVASGVGARGGVLFKTAASLENAARAKTVVFDKTGTLTRGELSVSGVRAYGIEESELLSFAASLEAKSEHPIAKAIVNYAKSKGARIFEAEDFKAVSGSGAEAVINGSPVVAASHKYAEKIAPIPEKLETTWKNEASLGKTTVFFIKDGSYIGLISCEDKPRSEAQDTVAELNSMGFETVMLTGDNKECARHLAEKLHLYDYRAEMLPSEKAEYIEKLDGGVIMVGDGINDAPALAAADVGIALGSGTDIAIESADVLIVGDSLSSVNFALKLARGTLKTIKQNLFFAFFYNFLAIPLAAGVFVSLVGWELSPGIASLAMSLSSVSVVTNALRLNFKKTFQQNKTRKSEEKKMIKLKVSGMMCPHCEARVKAALEAFEGVCAEVNYKTDEAIVSGNVSQEMLIEAVKMQGYECSIAE